MILSRVFCWMMFGKIFIILFKHNNTSLKGLSELINSSVNLIKLSV